MTVFFILYAILLGKTASDQFLGIKSWIESTLGWYYVLVMFSTFVVCLYVMCSRVGKIRLGRDDERREFSNFAWFSMLFGCGTGAGMLFFSMSEPMIHLASDWSGGNPFLSADVKAAVAAFFEAKQAALASGLMPGDEGFPVPDSRVAEAAAGGIKLTVFHWGTIAWAMYAIVGLSLAYFAFRKGLPLSMRSALYPLIGNRIYGPIGHTVDILTVFGTIFGIATTLGLGVEQIGSGLMSLGLIEEKSRMVTVVSIVLISVIATLSATSGVARGIKLLSTFNTWVCLGILAYFLLVSDANYLIASSITSLGDYLTDGVSMTLWTARTPDEQVWQGGWTIFYWGWWIAWAGFVGMFIARISRGRTIREFILGVMVIRRAGLVRRHRLGGHPSVPVRGRHGHLYGCGHQLGLRRHPLPLVRGAHSRHRRDRGQGGSAGRGDHLLRHVCGFRHPGAGRLLAFGRRPPVQQRIIWGMMLGAVTLILLLLGGDQALKSLQAASIAGALPFTFVLIAMMIGLLKSLREDGESMIENEEHIRKMIENEVRDLS